MGKPNADTRNLQKLAVKLEEAGLITRGEFGGTNYKDRFQLELKKQVIETRLNLPRSNQSPGDGKINPEGTVENNTPPRLNSPPVNKKLKKKLKKKLNIMFKTKVVKGVEIEFRILPSDRLERAGILNKLETKKGSKLLDDYDPEDILEWLEELSKHQHLYGVSRAKMMKWLQDWNPEEF